MTNRSLWRYNCSVGICFFFLSDADSRICSDLLFSAGCLCYWTLEDNAIIFYFDNNSIRGILLEKQSI